ncbi:MAG: 2-desacetyl-2-hydroxyethyl bacteriochlorophyllide A dehydrogenase [Verrucomicrobiales bacterium]|jgi:2-desacetyl-2-hydroxyethyl bacteriochlorophyllide A dehydrogenase
MRAMMLEAIGAPLVMREQAEPKPAPHEVTISVEACGVCGTDLKLQKGVFPEMPLPFILGHEIAGRVTSAGGPEGEHLIGRLVVVPLAWTCGACEACRRGADQFCSALVGRPGFTSDGGLRDVMCAPAHLVVPLGDEIDPLKAAVLADCIATVHHAIGRAQIERGERVLIVGAGGLGIHALQLLVRIGAEVSVSEPDPVKRQLALDRGAVATLEPAELTILPPTNGSFATGYSAAFDFVGNESSTAVALSQLVPGGRLVLVGYTPDAEISSVVFEMVRNERQILGSRASTHADLVEASELLATGAIEAIVSKTYKLGDVNDAFADLAGGQLVGRGVIDLRIGRPA